MKKLFLLTKTLLVATVLLMGGANSAWGADVNLFTANATANLSVPASTTDQELTNTNATITGGKMFVTNGQGSAKDLIATANKNVYFVMTNNNTSFKVKSNQALKAGDKIKFDVYYNSGSGSADLGLWFTTASSRPGSAPTANKVESVSGGASKTLTYTVAEDDGICGESTFYIYRNASTTYFDNVIISRDYTTVYSQDFEDVETYTSGWTQATANFDATIGQVNHGSGKALQLSSKDNKRTSTYSYSFSSLTAFTSSNDFRMEFDMATCGTSTNNNSDGGFIVYSGSNVVFSAMLSSAAEDKNLVVTGTATPVTVSDYNKAASPWLHVVLLGTSEGVWATVTNTTASTTIVNNVKISETAVNITKLDIKTTRNYYYMYLDNVICQVDINPYKTRASSAVSAYTAVKDRVMNSTVKSTLDGAKTALDAFVDDAAIAANISGYISAISALEIANKNAVTSADNFDILNELIGNSKPAGYVAPSGAETVYTSNADVDPVALASSVRAAVITAGTASENTDISGLIINNSFELGTTYGWTTTASDDTGARRNDNATYTTTGTDGDYLFNTWSQGTPIKQNIGTLPAGRYKLFCLVASNGGTIYLTMNDSHEGHKTTGDGGSFENAEYTFTLGSDTEVTIGAVGGDSDGNYTAEGHWWYKADKFTLTYVGEDPVAVAKASLEAEIETANTLKDSWTPKVGTAPFKYDATYYNALGTQITSATSVLNSGSETVSDYTSAESALETAESNMASSTQNTPDPDKYYQIFVANNDGTPSDYNLYMLKETTKTQVTVSATPYPVKFEAITSGTYNGRYYIKTPYSHSLCCDATNQTTAYVTEAEGVSTRLAEIAISLQDNGTIKIYGTKSGDQYKYAASASEGAGVTATTSNTGTWVVSDPVDVTDVNLAVNATTGWGTFIAPYDNLTPSTVKAYTVSHKEDGSIYFTENETGVLSANTPYILSTEEVSNVSVAFKGIANNDKNTYEVNGLVGLLAAETVPANSYILQYQAGKVGTAFYKLASDMTGTAYRCYLDLDNVPVINNARTATRMSIYGGVTGVENAEVAEATAKKNGAYLENGKIAIYKNGVKYNAAGAKLY